MTSGMPGVNGYGGGYGGNYDRNDDRHSHGRGPSRDDGRGQSRDDPRDRGDPYRYRDDGRSGYDRDYQDSHVDVASRVANDPYRSGDMFADRPGRSGTSTRESSSRGGFQDDQRRIEDGYEVDHLATFTVGTTQGLLNPSDGVAKLRHMEASTGIWTMRVQLVIDDKDVIIYDKATLDEMERFSLTLVADPTAVTNRRSQDRAYNNIVLFTVTEDMYRRNPTEMHLFQSVTVPAETIVDEIREAKEGRFRRRTSPKNHQRGHVGDHINKYEDEAKRNMEATDVYNRDRMERNPFPRTSFMQEPEQESVMSERTDKDVQMLNHCFDDIEKFVGRLQHAAESFKELDRRRKGHDKHKRGHGEGMLTMRARPPPAKDFIDIFQKFKLSFNLLAKLKPHIHDPNAPELVHFLFTPLSLVVEASKDPRNGAPDLAAKVISPLISHDAKDLLLNCLTSKEVDLWTSLGDAWTLRSDQWKGYVPPYYPRFSDGWTPSYNQPDGRVSEPDYASTRRPHRHYDDEPEPHFPADRYPDHLSQDTAHHRGPDMPPHQKYVQKNMVDRPPRDPEPLQHQQHSAPMSPWETEQNNFLRELKRKGAKICEVVHDRSGRNAKEVSVVKGELLEVIDDTRNWWKVRNAHQQEGHAPYTIVQLYKGDGHTREGVDEGVPQRGLSPSPGISPQPTFHLTPHTQQQEWQNKDHLQSGMYFQEESDEAFDEGSIHSSNSSQEDKKVKTLHDELKLRMSMGKSAASPRKRPATQTSNITQHSSPAEVQHWLQLKKFSDHTQRVLEGKEGMQLFKLSRLYLDTKCGKEEGSRLDSQLTIQKSLAGYDPGKSEELQFILQNRRHASEATADDKDSNDSNSSLSYGLYDDTGNFADL